MKRYPVKGSYYLHKQKVYKVVQISRATDNVYLRGIFDSKTYTESFSVFCISYERVITVSQLAKLLGRAPRSIYRYEQRGQVEKPNRYLDTQGRLIRFYRMKEVLDMHELLSMIHIGRPRKDKRIINNTLLDRTSFMELLKERFND